MEIVNTGTNTVYDYEKSHYHHHHQQQQQYKIINCLLYVIRPSPLFASDIFSVNLHYTCRVFLKCRDIFCSVKDIASPYRICCRDGDSCVRPISIITSTCHLLTAASTGLQALLKPLNLTALGNIKLYGEKDRGKANSMRPCNHGLK